MAAGFSTARLNAAIEAAVTGVTHMELHDGDPGAAGTANTVSNTSGRVAVDVDAQSASNGTVTATTATFTITAGGETYSWISLWTASSGGTWMGNGQLSQSEAFGGAGELDVTLSSTAANA